MAAIVDDEAAAASAVFEADCVTWVDVIIEVTEDVCDVEVVEEICDDVDDDEEVKEEVVDDEEVKEDVVGASLAVA